MNPGFTLLDGQARNKANPGTFAIPSKKDIDNLKVGDWVKIGIEGPCARNISGERFWVRISQIGAGVGAVKGTVDQDMLFTAKHGIKNADKMEFEERFILGTLTQEEIT